MNVAEFGVMPQRSADPAAAFALLRAHGAAIVTGAGDSREDARAVAERILVSLDPIVPDPAPIKEGGGNRDRSYQTPPGDDKHAVPFQYGHTDGFSYGDQYPDFIFLLCARPADAGGESYVVDTYQLLEALATSEDADDRELAAFLQSVPIEQTEPGMRASIGPAIGRNAHGRIMSRWTPVQRPVSHVPAGERERQQRLLARWTDVTNRASREAPRFMLQAGEALCIDNYRMLHGRSGFDDLERSLWRIWAWTAESLGVPEGLLFSDSRYAVVD